jgi:hypothetical protein
MRLIRFQQEVVDRPTALPISCRGVRESSSRMRKIADHGCRKIFP